MFEIQNNNIDEQIESYKKQFKLNIGILVEKGMLKEAEELVNEYEKLVSDDIEIYSNTLEK